jgi:dynein heavy chain
MLLLMPICCVVHILQDLETYKKSAVAVAKKYFTINDIDDFYKKKDARPLMFCHFARSLGDKTYDEVCLSAGEHLV